MKHNTCLCDRNKFSREKKKKNIKVINTHYIITFTQNYILRKYYSFYNFIIPMSLFNLLPSDITHTRKQSDTN